jgi:membrane protein YdbS with pleckstrin-like domain
LLGAAFGAWLGIKRHRRTLWKLDEQGFALQRGRWWQTESRVPVSRVQHLDLKRGPLERAFKLATLVIHTAGTKMAAVSVSGLDGEDAERLRDRLAHQLDHDDAL